MLECEINADAKLSVREIVAVILAAVWPLVWACLGVGIVAALLSGCVYKGAKVTEGTDLAIGLNVPVSEGTLQFQALNYLSGFRLGVDRNAILKCEYAVCESNDWFGCVHTRVKKTMSATVEPCEVSTAADSSAAVPSDSGSCKCGDACKCAKPCACGDACKCATLNVSTAADSSASTNLVESAGAATEP